MNNWTRLVVVALLAMVFLLLPACGPEVPTPAAYPTYIPYRTYTPLTVETSPDDSGTPQARQELASLYQAGMDAFDRGAWWEAADYFRQVTVFDPHYADVGHKLAEARARVGILTYTRGGRDSIVYSVNAAGGPETALFPTQGAQHLVWSPDGSRIAYLEGGKPRNQLGVMRADGSGRTVVVRASDISVSIDPIEDLDWSPDGTSIVFTASSRGLGIVNSAGGSPSMLPCTTSSEVVSYPGTGVRSVSWSPDGQTIVFGTAGGYPDATAATDPQGTNCRRLAAFEDGVDLLWAPDGQRVAFWTERFVARDQGLEIAESGGSNRVLAVDRYNWLDATCCANTTLAWSPDGQYLAFADDVPRAIYVYIPSIQGVFQIVESGDPISSLNWLPK